MPQVIAALHSELQGSGNFYFWIFFYFGLGFALFSVLVGLVYFAAIVRNSIGEKNLPSYYAHIVIFIFGALSVSAGIAVLAVVRALILGDVDTPKTASLALVVGALVPVFAHGILNRRHIVLKKTSTD